MNVRELIEALEALPPEAKDKPCLIPIGRGVWLDVQSIRFYGERVNIGAGGEYAA